MAGVVDPPPFLHSSLSLYLFIEKDEGKIAHGNSTQYDFNADAAFLIMHEKFKL